MPAMVIWAKGLGDLKSTWGEPPEAIGRSYPTYCGNMEDAYGTREAGIGAIWP